MTETLKTIRALHLALVLLSVIIFTFANSPDLRTTYGRALSEVTALAQLSFEGYVRFVHSNFEPKLREEYTRILGGEVRVSKDLRVSHPLVLNTPSPKSSLGEIMAFLGQPHRTELLKPQGSAEAKLKDRVLKSWEWQRKVNKSNPLEVISISFVLSNSVPHTIVRWMGDPVRLPFEQHGIFVLSKRPGVPIDGIPYALPHQLAVYKMPESEVEYGYTVDITSALGLGPAEFYEHFAVDCCSSTWHEIGDAPRDWLSTNPAVARLLLGRGTTTSVLPNVQVIKNQIESMDLSQAGQFLERKLDDIPKSISAWGVTIDESVALWGAPLSTFVVSLVLLLYLRRLLDRAAQTQVDCSDSPWSGIFPGRIPVVLNIATILVFPLISNALLLWRGYNAQFPAAIALGAGIVLTAGCVLCSALAINDASKLVEARRASKLIVPGQD